MALTNAREQSTMAWLCRKAGVGATCKELVASLADKGPLNNRRLSEHTASAQLHRCGPIQL